MKTLPYINTVAETPPHKFICFIANAAIDLSKNENKYLYFLVISLGAKKTLRGMIYGKCKTVCLVALKVVFKHLKYFIFLIAALIKPY